MPKQQTLFDLPPRVAQPPKWHRRTRCKACGRMCEKRCSSCGNAMDLECCQMTDTLCQICWEMEPDKGIGEAVVNPEALYRGIEPKQAPA